jgi:hypothetical protein
VIERSAKLRASDEGAPHANPDCPSCSELRARVEELIRERDAALERAEDEHARAELFLRAVPDQSWVEQPPLRYRLADRAHHVLQRGAPLAHAVAKRIGRWFEGATTRRRPQRVRSG